MSITGKLEKMLILGFKDSKEAENGGKAEAKINNAYFEALINPETYIHEYKLKYADAVQGHGTTGQEMKYEKTEPEEMSFDFLFDNTGIIDGKPRESIGEDIKKFKELLVEYKGDSHQPNVIKLIWGNNAIFIGRVLELNITYKLFSSSGFPLRAVAKVKFKSTVENQKRVEQENNSSPDLTHVRLVKAGDTLPLMCRKIYNNPKYYLEVARYN
ncbi:MAG TPA: hypothetical protein VK590_10405, partial [Saprospiraceae bacterium]|nr:hypothetical protein [Saprospiraceae bacterium]